MIKIAIDGTAASGKGTLAKKLAKMATIKINNPVKYNLINSINSFNLQASF